jgi:hypothetical protein
MRKQMALILSTRIPISSSIFYAISDVGASYLYDNGKGHNHALYLALLEETKYFQIPRLEHWLKGKRFLQAIKIRYFADELEGHLGRKLEAWMNMWNITRSGRQGRCTFAHVESLFIVVTRVHVAGSMNAQGDAENVYEDEQILKTLVIQADYCRSGGLRRRTELRNDDIVHIMSLQ